MKNNYSSFIQQEDMQNNLKRITSRKEITKGGIPLCYDDENLYIDESFGHNLVIGATGSGKTQSVTLPKVFTSLIAGENLFVDDPKGEIYNLLKDELETNGYKAFKIDFQNFNGNKWNPLELAWKLYKEQNIDDAVMILEKTAYYIFTNYDNNNNDPFWINCVKQLFTGTALYIMEKENVLPTIHEISNYAEKITIDDFNNLNQESPAKVFLRIIMTAPKDTKGSIYAVFNSSIMNYSYSNKINTILEKNDFDLENLLEDKVALFIIDGHKKANITNLMALFIEELQYICDKKNNQRKINIVLDDFNDYVALENLGQLLSNARSNYMEYTILINSLHKLSEIYGETALEHIISYFDRIIYLYSKDEYTTEYISKLCGNKNDKERLISSTELKLLKIFEVVILKNRMLPFKTKLLPFYQYRNK